MSKAVIYYTSNTISEPICELVQRLIYQSNLPIISSSLKPILFGQNIVLDMLPGPVTVLWQILSALEACMEDFVFFCEHDVLYHPSHFKFTENRRDTFYYNVNVWRYDPRSGKIITYDHLRSLSGLYVYRELAIKYFRKKLLVVYEKGYDKISGTNPKWARVIGYEPGKPRRSGGISDDKVEEWKSEYSNIDIRHDKTMTPRKMTIESFNHFPTGWRESVIQELPGWDKNVWTSVL